jgi:uncharacterized protein YwlG (UPF0340 family)
MFGLIERSSVVFCSAMVVGGRVLVCAFEHIGAPVAVSHLTQVAAHGIGDTDQLAQFRGRGL